MELLTFFHSRIVLALLFLGSAKADVG